MSMNYLKPLGIERNISSLICIGIITLLLFGLATNAIFDLSHGVEFKPYNFWINIGYIFAFMCWIWLLRRASSQKHLHIAPSIIDAVLGEPYQGIVLILSKPKDTTPQDINKAIEEEYSKNHNNLTMLYGIQSIGQLFKGIYKHRDSLEYIWPIVTEDSRPFRECIKNFIQKYAPNAKLANSRDNGEDYCLLPKCGEGTEMINNIKKAVSAIYSEENLDPYGLKKRDVIMDMSGGTKPMTIGAVFGAIDKEIDFQYVEQTSNQLIGVSITPENILDKLAEYLMGLLKDKKISQKPSHADNG